MKLKTLKELQEKWIDYQMNDDDKAMILDLFDDLKIESVKWIKYYQKIKYNEPEYAKRRIQIQWIKHFFNLTEEDLSE